MNYKTIPKAFINKALKYYQPTHNQSFEDNFSDYQVWFDKNRCIEDTGCGTSEVIDFWGDDIQEPIFKITTDEAALWAFKNLNVGENQVISRNVEEHIILKDYFVETINLIRTESGVQVKFYNISTYIYDELNDNFHVDTWNYQEKEFKE